MCSWTQPARLLKSRKRSRSSLPAAVKDGLQTKAGKGKLVKVESLTKHDKLVAYEAQVNTNGKKSEVQVGPDGKALDHEE
jgi:hypothetical protein